MNICLTYKVPYAYDDHKLSCSVGKELSPEDYTTTYWIQTDILIFLLFFSVLRLNTAVAVHQRYDRI